MMMTKSTPGRAGRGIALATMLMLSTTAHASPETLFSTDVFLGAGYATSPYLTSGSARGSGTATVEVRPVLDVRTQSSSFRVEGSVRRVEFFREYDPTMSYSLAASGTGQVAQNTSVNGSLGFYSSRSGVNQSLYNIVDPGGTTTLPPSVVDDALINGANIRQRNFSANVGLSHRFTAVDSVNLGASASALRVPRGRGLDEYNYFTQSVEYARRLSDTTQVGLGVIVGESNYLRTRVGDGRTITPQLSITRNLPGDYVLTASGGASFSRFNDQVGRRSSTDLAGSLSLCRQRDLSNLCARIDRAVQPSAIGGPRARTTVGLAWGRTLTQTDTVSVTANYSRSGEAFIITNPVPPAGPPTTPTTPSFTRSTRPVDYVSLGANYDHRFTQRIAGFVSAGYSDTFQKGINRTANYQANVGVRIRLGAIR